MSIFDRIDKQFGRPKPIRLEPAKEGDPCPDPKCGGRFAFALGGSGECYCSLLRTPCGNCESSVLICTECGEHEPEGDEA